VPGYSRYASPAIFSGREIADAIHRLEFTHVVWVPDSVLGLWEGELEAAEEFRLLRVCREGEAWPLAAGLHLGGKRPLVIMQCTGLFESGDALRNVLFDLKLPIVAIVGYRSYLVRPSSDSAKRFTEPILDAWGIDHRVVATEEDKPQLAAHLASCLQAEKPGVVLLAEGST
jgi:sulfopyruvate decarboxylase TPP-binding subunit